MLCVSALTGKAIAISLLLGRKLDEKSSVLLMTLISPPNNKTVVEANGRIGFDPLFVG